MSTKLLAPFAAAAVLLVGGCASDEPTEQEPTDVTDVTVDEQVDDGIDTEVEKSENLGFDESDEG